MEDDFGKTKMNTKNKKKMLSWSLIITVVAVLAVLYREYRWSLESGNLKEIVNELNKDLDATLNALWINAVTSGYQVIYSFTYFIKLVRAYVFFVLE